MFAPRMPQDVAGGDATGPARRKVTGQSWKSMVCPDGDVLPACTAGHKKRLSQSMLSKASCLLCHAPLLQACSSLMLRLHVQRPLS